MKNEKSVLLAFTGGKKSTVAAYLLLKQGFKVTGCSFLMGDLGSTCTLNDLGNARKISTLLGIPHTTVDLRAEYSEKIIQPLIGARLSGEEFNTCYDCNILKLETLLKKANEKKFDFVATGHMASLAKDPDGFKLLQGKEEDYDQSFFLSGLRENLLERLILPIGKLSKKEIDKIAESIGIELEEVKNPRELCIRDLSKIIPVIEKEVPLSLRKPGLIINEETGLSLGQHNGIYNFKLGPLKHGLSQMENSKNFSVVGFDTFKNNVLVKENLHFGQDRIELKMFNSFLDIDLTGPLNCRLAMGPKEAKIACTVFLGNNGHAVAKTEKPIEGHIEKGSLVVFYDLEASGQRLIAAGFVTRVGQFIKNQKEEGYFLN